MNLLAAMKIFIKVAEISNFSQAALALHIPKASVTTAIQQLEKKLATRLLYRTTRTVRLTQEGIIFLDRCKNLVSEFNEIETMFKLEDANIEGLIRIGLSDLLAQKIVVPQLPEFLDVHSAVELEILNVPLPPNLQDNFDCWITAEYVLPEHAPAKSLGEITFINCVSPSYVERFGSPASLADLNHHHLITAVPLSEIKVGAFNYVDGKTLNYAQTLRVLSIENIESSVAGAVAGLGIIQVPKLLVEQKLKDALLIEVLPDFQKPPLTICLRFPKHRRVSLRVRVFIEWIEETIKVKLNNSNN